MPAVIDALDCPLSGYGDHADETRDDQTIWSLIDCNPTALVQRYDYIHRRWETLYDVLRDYRDPRTGATWPANYKIGGGHTLTIGPRAVALSLSYKNTDTGHGGRFSIWLARDSFPPMGG